VASVTPRVNPGGSISFRVQYRVSGKIRQETFTDEKAAFEFADLVDRVGGDTARKVRVARSTAPRVSPRWPNGRPPTWTRRPVTSAA
jgi:hypothetical protein